MNNQVEIKKVKEHYEIYIDNKFYCSCDNWTEVQEELENFEKQD